MRWIKKDSREWGDARGVNGHYTINTVKERVFVENVGSKMSRHELPTSGSFVKPRDPVRACKLKGTVSGSGFVTISLRDHYDFG